MRKTFTYIKSEAISIENMSVYCKFYFKDDDADFNVTEIKVGITLSGLVELGVYNPNQSKDLNDQVRNLLMNIMFNALSGYIEMEQKFPPQDWLISKPKMIDISSERNEQALKGKYKISVYI